MPIIILISVIFFLILLVILLVIQCSVLTNQNIYLEKKLILTEGRLDLLEANFVLFKDETSLETRRYADEFLRSKRATKAEEIDSHIRSNNKRFLYPKSRKKFGKNI